MLPGNNSITTVREAMTAPKTKKRVRSLSKTAQIYPSE
jgi:hypothetical protein